MEETFRLYLVLPIIYSWLWLYSSFLAEASSFGFTIDLIHRDSPLSPFYNPSNSHFENLRNSFHRSVARSSPAIISSPLYSIPGEYLTKVGVGTPPVDIFAIADTGSDLSWTQCTPCPDCFKQKDPLFNPRKSSTYRNLACESKPCDALRSTTCSTSNVCEYSVSYGDRSYSNGDLAVETFTFGSPSGQRVPVKNIFFGCGHDNAGTFNERSSGIIGLGRGPLSIINQLSKEINGKFSYCLAPPGQDIKSSGRLNFGSNAVVSGPGTVSTPLVSGNEATFYSLTLESVSVGDTSLKFISNPRVTGPTMGPAGNPSGSPEAPNVEEGNIIIDSGTTLTYLPYDMFPSLVDEIKKYVGLDTVPDPQGFFDLCYKDDVEGFTEYLPNMVFHFKGADLNLPKERSFLEVSEGISCLVMKSADAPGLPPILGNLAQINVLVGYDLVNKKVSFKETEC